MVDINARADLVADSELEQEPDTDKALPEEEIKLFTVSLTNEDWRAVLAQLGACRDWYYAQADNLRGNGFIVSAEDELKSAQYLEIISQQIEGQLQK